MRSSTSSSRRRRTAGRWAPLPLGAAVFTVALGLWHWGLEPPLHSAGVLLPSSSRLSVEDFRTQEKLRRAFGLGPSRHPEVLLVGDSRAGWGISPASLENQSGYSCARLCAPGARLMELTRQLPSCPPRKVVVALSPASVLRSGRALPPRRHRGWPDFRGAIDRSLNEKVDGLRWKVVRPVAFEHRFRSPGPRASDAQYRRILGEAPAPAEKLRTLRGQLRTLKKRGWEIVCVRMPISESLWRIEEEHFPSELFLSMCEELGVLYLDYSRSGYRTRDGSHLHGSVVEEFSRRLACDLRKKAGW